jgi:hypothetical protein
MLGPRVYPAVKLTGRLKQAACSVLACRRDGEG